MPPPDATRQALVLPPRGAACGVATSLRAQARDCGRNSTEKHRSQIPLHMLAASAYHVLTELLVAPLIGYFRPPSNHQLGDLTTRADSWVGTWPKGTQVP